MFDAFGLPVGIRQVPLYDGRKAEALAALAPARLDTLAIAETLAERHPEAGLGPDQPAARATARWHVAEMHSGFAALRSACPMNLRRKYRGYSPGAGVRADLARIEALWYHALSGSGGPWLFGRYTLADVFYAPVAVRIAGYDLAVSERSQHYVRATTPAPLTRRVARTAGRRAGGVRDGTAVRPVATGGVTLFEFSASGRCALP